MEKWLQVKGTELTVFLPAEVDHHNAEELKRETDRQLMEHNVRRIIFDFSHTIFMDSSGIGMIMGRYKNIRFMGGSVCAVHVNDRMHRILSMSGIGKVMEINRDSRGQSGVDRRGSI